MIPSVKSVILGTAAALGSFGLATATSCSGPVINSISYCNPVDQISYSDLGYSGTYQDVTGMDLGACTCSYAPKAFSGPLAPLNEGLSLHIRGPVYLKQFAVYYPAPPNGNNYNKRAHHQHLGRHHAHHKRAMVYTTITETVVVDAAGSTIWPKPTETGQGLYDNPHETSVPKTGNGDKGVDNHTFDYSDGDVTAPDGSWVRKAYYDAESQTREGLVFMNHRGGQGSGDFDMNCGGNSISYMSPDAKKGSATPQTLQNAPVNTRDEYIIFSDEECDESCGFYRPGIPAYKGFAGSKKIFVFEFSMPNDVTDQDFNNDLPAIWALNSKIPRTSQYGIGGKPCSCWDSGCGELDLFEVLKDANSMCKTHYHSKQGAVGQYGGGGDVSYFPRPLQPVKYAVYFDGDKNVKITKLPSNISFPKAFSGEDIIKKVTGMIKGILSSDFKVPM